MKIFKQLIIILRAAAFFAVSVVLSCFITLSAFASDEQIAVSLDITTDDSKSYQPGSYIDYILIINNLYDPVWLRLNIALSQSGIDSAFDESCLNILDNWTRIGDYYYYTEKVEASSSVEAVNGIILPDINSSTKGSYVSVTVYAEAVLYSSLDPDFESDDPWQDVSDTYTVTNSSSGNSSGSSSSGSSSVGGSAYSTLHAYDSPINNAIISTGAWELIGVLPYQWMYHDTYGNYAKNGWYYLYNPYSCTGNYYGWFHFDEDGIMTYGWYKASESDWYYTHGISDGDLGLLKTGWLYETADNRSYYLDDESGIMLTGWQNIGGSNYYFATLSDIPQQTWFWNTIVGKWLYELLGFRSYGSMYADELTPDGIYVGPDGSLSYEEDLYD